MHYLEYYTPEQMRRHGAPRNHWWAQVNGRNAISWEDKFALDVWYVDNRSFLLDLRILLRTLGDVIFRRGISAEGSATMPEFAPSPPERRRKEPQEWA
jgi:lipopolysaccharide/colanic/teichoic acid biosynthesis glycosyltransferase